MADLVLGVGTSHSPMLSLDGAGWLAWGARDRDSPHLVDGHGRLRSWQDRVDEVGSRFTEHLSVDRCDQAYRRTVGALDSLAAALEDAELDAVVVIGDDQNEHLFDSNLPPILVYWGDSILNTPQPDDDASPLVRQYRAGYYEPSGSREYGVDVKLARLIIDTMLGRSIDVASSRSLPIASRSMGHAFAFPLRRLIPHGVQIVPVMLNTYNPPTQPRAARCVDYGNAIRAAIEEHRAGARIGVLASGGLSHMLVLADLDAMVIDALERADLNKLTELPEPVLQAGTSEVKNWITAAAACRQLSFRLVDYVPGYRSEAGSGVGLTFGLWQ